MGDESHNEDGKHTAYLQEPRGYRDCDPRLFCGLKKLLDGPGPRAVWMIERSSPELLPQGTKYVSEPLTREGRSEWLSRAVEEVRDRDVVLLILTTAFSRPRSRRATRMPSNASCGRKLNSLLNLMSSRLWSSTTI